MIENFDERFERAFDHVAFAVNRHIIEHQVRISRDLGLDLESAYIWGLLAHLNVTNMLAPDLEGAFNLPPKVVETALRGVRLTDLVQISGLPRETMRRKLLILQKLGKTAQTSDGNWVITIAGVDLKTREFTKETVIRFLRVADEIKVALNHAKP